MTVEFPPVSWFMGDEDVARKRAVTELTDGVFGGGSPSFNLAKFNAADGAERAVEVARTVPMMANHRVVVIQDMQSATVELLEQLLSYVEKPNPSTVLILEGVKTPPATGGVDRGRRLENVVKVGAMKTGRHGVDISCHTTCLD